MINEDNGSPAFNLGDTIPVNNYPDHDWYRVSLVELALKNTPVNSLPYWEGAWKQVSHKYLALQVGVAQKKDTTVGSRFPSIQLAKSYSFTKQP
ncbi:hypothetical protein [Paraflavitalea speifideaquila]|uniref:hypothetical protein n=1 Tax=Paraflavitalea speifideaquila TaxID=3076558 RepID=UPI0028E4F554|nr:hypothetical protein [Paraflavitalea speifideiaquila]